MTPDAAALFSALEATWPPASCRRVGPWTIREGRGGGKRVSAATAEAPWASDDILAAERACRALGQSPLFMIRPQDGGLDIELDRRGYAVADPVDLLTGPAGALLDDDLPRQTGYAIWPPLAIAQDIWREGGIGPGRLAVMDRVQGPKTALMGRHGNRACAVAFVACDGPLAMLHALEVAPRARRLGMGKRMMTLAARWAAEQGARDLAVLVTRDNLPAKKLYASLGMSPVGHYHYRSNEESM